MNTSSHASLHAYYATQDVSVSHRNLQDDAALAAHCAWRQQFYTDKLHLSPGFFKGLRVGEFGCDTGENALVFARCGARLTLVEPNIRAHPVIQEYFTRFGLQDQLELLSSDALEDFTSDNPFDFINAEGFVGAITPHSRWLGAMDRLLHKDGLFLISYFERYGCFVEQITRVLIQLLARSTGIPHKEAAHCIMQHKWNRIAHSRPFDAWYMDAIQNPFAQAEHHIDAQQLLLDAGQHGFRLHISTPHYTDARHIGWYKQSLCSHAYSTRASEHIQRSRLGWILGQEWYLTASMSEVEHCNQQLQRMMHNLQMIMHSQGEVSLIHTQILALQDMLHMPHLGDDTTQQRTLNGIAELANALLYAQAGDIPKLQHWAAHEPWFTQQWGTPVHFAVFRRESS